MPPLQCYVRDCSQHPSHVSFQRDSRRGASGDRESRGEVVRVVPGNSGGGPHWLALSGDSWRLSGNGRPMCPPTRRLLRPPLAASQ
jgi:hypothetical protein